MKLAARAWQLDGLASFERSKGQLQKAQDTILAMKRQCNIVTRSFYTYQRILESPQGIFQNLRMIATTALRLWNPAHPQTENAIREAEAILNAIAIPTVKVGDFYEQSVQV